ncbi:MAG: hypothetical protein B7Y01_01745, partial [Xanthobacter sp. 17-67-6]
MIRTTLGLIALFAMIAAACVAFGAYFSYVTLQNAHRNAVEARFSITAERIAATAQFAASLGIALPAQTTLSELVAREAGGTRVYVKLHPAQRIETAAMVRALARKTGNLVISEASIHDLTQASEMVVTQNSAAGFEALMQRKPVITCA